MPIMMTYDNNKHGDWGLRSVPVSQNLVNQFKVKGVTV